MQPASSASSNFSTTFLNAAPPPIKREGESVVLNFTLTISESMFLTSVKSVIQSSLDQQYNVIFLATSESMQRGFREWVGRTFTSKEFSAEELNLVTIVSSIWMKTKTHIENELRISQDHAAIVDEAECQRRADNTAAEIALQGRSGKAFTVRQATFLIKAVNSIGKKN